MRPGELDDVDEFDVDTSISDTAKKRRDDEVARREQAAAVEIETIRGRVSVGTPPRGAPPARPNPLDTPARPVRAPSPSPLAEAFRRSVRSTATPIPGALDRNAEVRRPRRPVGSNPLDARAVPDASASDSALRRSATDSSAGAGFEDELFNTEINQLLSDVPDIGTAPVESTIDFEESRNRRPSASGERAIVPVAGATTQLRRGVSGWLLPLLLLTVAAAIGWYSGLLPDLISTLLE